MTKVRIELEDLKALFDVAVNSMDFGSGFLDTDEVNMLRRVAVVIGVDPMAGTPPEFSKRIPHNFTPYEEPRNEWRETACRWCGQRREAGGHSEEPA
jgi:hypothetical protein